MPVVLLYDVIKCACTCNPLTAILILSICAFLLSEAQSRGDFVLQCY